MCVGGLKYTLYEACKVTHVLPMRQCEQAVLNPLLSFKKTLFNTVTNVLNGESGSSSHYRQYDTGCMVRGSGSDSNKTVQTATRQFRQQQDSSDSNKTVQIATRHFR